MADFFDRQMADNYDQRNSGLSAISRNMHFLTDLVMADLPDTARILCVGVGTGAEILSLADAHPRWQFVGVDPSADMLRVCSEKLEQAGLMTRCTLVHGYAHEVDETGFDAALAILVAHFIPRADRAPYYAAVHERLKTGGVFVSTEICCDLDGPEFPELLKNWQQVQLRMGADQDSLDRLAGMLRNGLNILSPEDTVALLTEAGFAQPVGFFQSFMIRGFHARK